MNQLISDDFQFVDEVSAEDDNGQIKEADDSEQISEEQSKYADQGKEQAKLEDENKVDERQQMEFQQQEYEDRFEVEEVLQVEVKEAVLNQMAETNCNRPQIVPQQQQNYLLQLATNSIPELSSETDKNILKPITEHTPIHDSTQNIEQKPQLDQQYFQGNSHIKHGPQQQPNQHINSQENSYEQLQQQIQQMQHQVNQMLKKIDQKSNLLNYQHSQQHPTSHQSPQLHLLQSMFDNNDKTQKIYRSQLNSLLKKQTEFQLKTSQYFSKTHFQQSTPNSADTNSALNLIEHHSQPKQLVQLIEEEILKVKESILETEKANFTQNKTIKMLESLIEKQSLAGTISHPNPKLQPTKNSLIQLGESILLKKKLSQKLTQKLSKLQLQFNASFIKSQQANDHLNAILTQFPEFEASKSTQDDESFRMTSRRTTLDKWSAKSNEAILNKNLHQMLKKRKEKALKAKQLLKKQFEHQQKELQRDIKGLKALIQQKDTNTSEIVNKNQSLESKIIQSQIEIQLIYEEKKTKEKKSQTKQRQNHSQMIVREKEQRPQKKQILSARKQSQSEKMPISITLNPKEIDQLNRAQSKEYSLPALKQQRFLQSELKLIERNVDVQISLICADSSENNSNVISPAFIKEIEESPSPKKVDEENSNFRITRPKFPKFNKSKSINESNVSINRTEDQAAESASSKDQYLQSFSSPKLLKPFFGAIKSLDSSQVLKKQLSRNRSLSIQQHLSIEKDGDRYNSNKTKQAPNQQLRQSNLFRPRTPIKRFQKQQRPIISLQQHSNTPLTQTTRKQSQGQLPQSSKQQQMMNVLRQSIIHATSSSKKKKSVQKQVDNEKTLRNLLNQNLSMIRNESFTEPDVRKMKKFDSIEPRYNKGERRTTAKEESSEEANVMLDSVKTPKTKKRPYISGSMQRSTHSIKLPEPQPFMQPHKSPKPKQKHHQQQSLIESQMQKVKNQIQSTIMKIKSIQEKIERQSTFNSKHLRAGFYRTRMAVREREISFDQQSDQMQIDERQEVSESES